MTRLELREWMSQIARRAMPIGRDPIDDQRRLQTIVDKDYVFR